MRPAVWIPIYHRFKNRAVSLLERHDFVQPGKEKKTKAFREIHSFTGGFEGWLGVR